MKTKNYISPVIIFSSLLWLSLFFMQIFQVNSPDNISHFVAKIEFFFHAIILMLTFKIYSVINQSDRKIFKWLAIANFFLFLNDLTFYIAVYFPGKYVLSPLFSTFIIGFFPYIIWLFALMIFLLKILSKEVFSKNFFLKSFPCFLIVNIVLGYLFFSSVGDAFNKFSWQSIFHVFCFSLEFIIFDFIILLLIYLEDGGVALIISGFGVLISGDFFVSYSFLSQTTSLLIYGELLWFLGLILTTFGMLVLSDHRCHVKNWCKKNTIKSKVAFWSFSISVLGFILFFIIGYMFSIIDKSVFLSVPFFIIIYSIIVVSLSVLMGKKFEAPFKKLANNIEALMVYNNKAKVDTQFSTTEFVLLQKFIIDAFETKEKKDLAEKKLGQVVAQVAHDIRSPLSALDTLINSLQDKAPEKEHIMMRTAIRRINNIANDLVARYKGKEVIAETFVFIYSALKDIVSEKDLEYGAKNIRFELELDHPKSAFTLTKGNYTEIKRVFSNLINNAVNAMPLGGMIHVKCGQEVNDVLVKIIDQGHGLPQTTIDELFGDAASEEMKETKIGLGLRHAKEYMKQHHGQIKMISKEGVGSTVELSFKILPKPTWLCESIRIHKDDELIIVDDDASIHDTWTKKLEGFFFVRQDFYTPAACRDWLREAPVRSRVILCDYEFMNIAENGIQLLTSLEYAHLKKYLVTSNVDDAEVIAACDQADFELLPKHLLPYAQIEVISDGLKESFIFIDDEAYNREYWEYVAEKKNVNLKTFDSFEAFSKVIDEVDKMTPIYLDYNLGDKNGLEVAAELKNLGFARLYIATGHCDFTPEDYPWLSGVIGKKPPF